MVRKQKAKQESEGLSEQEMVNVLRQAQQARGEQALALYRQCREEIRRQFGFDIQPFAIIEIGQIVLDLKLVPIPNWQPPVLSPPSEEEVSDNGEGD